jgi:hypothetical protein
MSSASDQFGSPLPANNEEAPEMRKDDASLFDESLHPGEILLRRVHCAQTKDGLLTRGVYTPSPNDTDGLSFYRLADVSPRRLKESAAKPADEYVVVGLRVADILVEGLTVVRIPDQSPHALPGHCLVPELNIRDYSADKKRFIPIQHALLRKTIPEDQLPTG